MSAQSNAARVRELYDQTLVEGERVRGAVFPHVFGRDSFVGQYSDNTTDAMRRLAEAAAIDANSVVLDVGCGGAGPACFLVRETNCSVIGIDVSKRHLAAAHERVASLDLEHKVKLIEGDFLAVADQLPQVDVAIGLGAWCHFDPRELFPVCHSVLKPGGRVAFMERVLLDKVEPSLLHGLTEDWACPTVETFASYTECLIEAGFTGLYVEDLSEEYRALQQRFVSVRLELRDEIIALSSAEAYARDLVLVKAECDAALAGRLGYGMFVAQRAGAGLVKE
jgi:cyclopropane fatty-acyl-phospholipid synthase-like methyltransferase